MPKTERSVLMPVTTNFPFPKDDHVFLLESVYTALNGPDTLQPVQQWEHQNWSAAVHCCRGTVLEKACISRLHIAEGTINDTPASLSFLETLAYPANPRIPGFITMTNMNDKEDTGRTLVFYTDLIIQNGNLLEKDRTIFSESLKKICAQYGQNFDELNAFAAGLGLMGGQAGGCGFFYFFEESDIPFIEEVLHRIPETYKTIVAAGKDEQPGQEDYEQVHRSRARLIEWIIAEDKGIKTARENGVPMEFIEAYAFPPVIRY